jgi:hypothetical protein
MALDDIFIEMKLNSLGSFTFNLNGEVLNYEELKTKLAGNGHNKLVIGFGVPSRYWVSANNIANSLYDKYGKATRENKKSYK